MKKFFVILKNSILEKISYRGEIISGVIIEVVGMLLKLFLWHKIMSEQGSVSGYNFDNIVVYYLLVGAWNSVSVGGRKFAKSLMKDVNNGSFSSNLMKPMNPGLFYIASNLGFQLFRMLIEFFLFSFPIIIVSGWRSVLVFNWQILIVLFLYIILITLFSFSFFSCVGYIIFWLESGHGFRNIVNQILKVFKGSLFPLDIAPNWFLSFVSFLPFTYMEFYPVKILLGDITIKDGLKGILILLIYTIIFFILSSYLFKKGIKKYDSVGN